jgi:putative transposase
LRGVPWLAIRLVLFKLVYRQDRQYLLAADETVKAKSGKSTHGIGRFYSSIAKRVIPSISVLAISIIDTVDETSYILGTQQLMGSLKTTKPEKPKSKSKPQSKPKGRPKGSKNKPKSEPQGVSYLVLKTLLSLVTSQLKALLPDLQCFHLVLDVFYGHEDYLLLALENSLQIISKFKSNAHLVLPFEGQQNPTGRPKTKGNKVDLSNIDKRFFIQTIEDKESNVKTNVYQFKAYTPKMTGQLLNIVVMVHIHQITNRQSRTVLFSNDLCLDAIKIIKFYSLRFQIEFDFRDAKQFYGLADFKNYKQTQVTNAINIAFSMTLIGKVLLEKYKFKMNCPNMGIIDLKTIFRTQKYAQILSGGEPLNNNNFDPDDFLSSPQFLNIARLEAIHI